MRKISFKLPAQLYPVSIETSAKTMKELAAEILNNEELSKLIDVTTRIVPSADHSKTTFNVLVESKTMSEYYFDTDAVLPEGDVLFFVTPVTSKFGLTKQQKESILKDLETINTAVSRISGVLKKDAFEVDGEMIELIELEKAAQNIKKKLNDRYRRF